MGKMKKHLACLLALLFLVTMLPAGALAAGEEGAGEASISRGNTPAQGDDGKSPKGTPALTPAESDRGKTARGDRAPQDAGAQAAPLEAPTAPADIAAPQEGYATVILNVVSDTYGGGSGYHLLFDSTETALTSIPNSIWSVAPVGVGYDTMAAYYSNFTHKIPADAVCSDNTPRVNKGESAQI